MIHLGFSCFCLPCYYGSDCKSVTVGVLGFVCYHNTPFFFYVGLGIRTQVSVLA
ncbi:hypothetical protein I79_007566 [Cricetulus griseus]|uniref:Uncharacterized protein n=1 Tax=Cricetulus griseus TaxID=10029 RepID=G3HAV7_CRIGR|nr:hypothetical protein I79_007566 [Cricetulus griseus]